jgi:hypothetical protein
MIADVRVLFIEGAIFLVKTFVSHALGKNRLNYLKMNGILIVRSKLFRQEKIRGPRMIPAIN